ncbi:hypothetical protein Tco_1038483 [Tanacetum coccineum]
MEEIKRLEFLKAEKEKSEKKLKVLTPKQLRAQAEELAAYEAKRVKMMEEYNHCINFRADPLHITKISCRMLGFSEWLEIHALASKVKIKSNDLLLKNLKEKIPVEIRLSSKDSLSEKHQRALKDSLGAKHQRDVKGLAECKALASNLKRIQVKDIVKEVEDYLKIYSSVEMYSWYVERIR